MTTIGKDNFIVVYRMGDDESREFAEYYANKYNMDIVNVYENPSTGSYTETIFENVDSPTWRIDGQLVGISCSDLEILNYEYVFNEEVLFPLRGALDYIRTNNIRTVLGIVLGYNIPGGFYNASVNPSDTTPDSTPWESPSAVEPLGADLISSTSRVARGCSILEAEYHAFEVKLGNRFFDRKVFKRFDEADAGFCLICSRIDGPDLSTAKQMVDNANKLNKQTYVNGTFYIDPYSDIIGSSAEEYKNLLLEFYSGTLQKLYLDTWSTVFMDPYIDVAVPFVENDSFVWSWFTDRSHPDFFRGSNAARVFFYNADFDGAFTIRDKQSKTWPYLAISNDYISTAGSMSRCEIEGFLNPISFFEALLRGATLGEAYLFSLPYLEWTVTMIGDPLVSVSFKLSETPDDVSLEENESWYRMSKELAKTASNLYKKEEETEDIRNIVVDQTELEIELAILYPSNSLYLKNDKESRKSQLNELVNSLYEYPLRRFEYWGMNLQSPTINDYLTEKKYKISQLLTEISGSDIISESNLLDEGWWELEHILQEYSLNFVRYHFVLEVHSSSNYTNLIYKRDSGADGSSWTYEKNVNEFFNIPASGVPASYIGRRIKYTSREGEYLSRGTTYYFKIIQYDGDTGEIYGDWNLYDDIIYT